MHAEGKEVNLVDKCERNREALRETLRIVSVFSVLGSIATSNCNVDASLLYGVMYGMQRAGFRRAVEWPVEFPIDRACGQGLACSEASNLREQ